MADALLNTYLKQQKLAMDQRIKNAEAALKVKNDQVAAQESRARGNLIQNQGPQDLQINMKNSLPSQLVPGNLGDINQVYWPFWFTSTAPKLIPNAAGQGSITITYEAAFSWVSYTKAIFKEIVGFPGTYEYVDCNQVGALDKANGLTFLIRDAQSSRQFHDKQQNLNQVGNWFNPTILPSPCMFLPSSTVEIIFQNMDPAATYVPFITFFGYRVRVQDGQNLLSTVVG